MPWNSKFAPKSLKSWWWSWFSWVLLCKVQNLSSLTSVLPPKFQVNSLGFHQIPGVPSMSWKIINFLIRSAQSFSHLNLDLGEGALTTETMNIQRVSLNMELILVIKLKKLYCV